MNKQELAEYLGVKISTIETNFPKLCASQMTKGKKIIKQGKGAQATYLVEEVEPQMIDKSYFSTKQLIKAETLLGEEWIDCFCSSNYEVSNFGRVRNKKTHYQSFGNNPKNNDGYISISIDGEYQLLHRVVLQSWNPIKDYQSFTVEHLDGNRSNNRLDNLCWKTMEDNILAMIQHRKELNIELTRLIQKYGYNKTLKILQKIN